MDALSLHLTCCHRTEAALSAPFHLPDTAALAVEFEKKIEAAMVENILAQGRGPGTILGFMSS